MLESLVRPGEISPFAVKEYVGSAKPGWLVIAVRETTILRDY
jgi:hypothetical protein